MTDAPPDITAAEPTPTSDQVHSHVSPKTLCVTFGVLLILLAATVICAKLIHGTAGTFAGLTIAVAKTLLIAVIFMNLKGSVGLIRLASAAALLWLALFVLITMGDFATRGWDEPNDHVLQGRTDLQAYNTPSPDGESTSTDKR